MNGDNNIVSGCRIRGDGNWCAIWTSRKVSGVSTRTYIRDTHAENVLFFVLLATSEAVLDNCSADKLHDLFRTDVTNLQSAIYVGGVTNLVEPARVQAGDFEMQLLDEDSQLDPSGSAFLPDSCEGTEARELLPGDEWPDDTEPDSELL
jgi:hypothetical protein